MIRASKLNIFHVFEYFNSKKVVTPYKVAFPNNFFLQPGDAVQLSRRYFKSKIGFKTVKVSLFLTFSISIQHTF